MRIGGWLVVNFNDRENCSKCLYRFDKSYVVKKAKHAEMKKLPFVFMWNSITKLRKTHAGSWLGWQLFDTKEYMFFPWRHTKFYYEDILQNPKVYTLS